MSNLKKVILYNPEKVITENEIFSEAKVDSDGNITPKVKPPFYETTDRSLEWTIRKGETLEFPEYVAQYLVKVYPFLEIKGESEEPGLKVEAKSKEGVLNCKFCGSQFNSTKGLALHLAHRHTEAIV